LESLWRATIAGNKERVQMVDPFKDKRDYRSLAVLNGEAIEAYNQNMLTLLTAIGALMMLIPVVAVPFSRTKVPLLPIYIVVVLCFSSLALISKVSALRRFSLPALYVGFSIFFVFAIYLSIVHTPTMRATILIGVVSLSPLAFIDRPLRVNLFVAFWVVLHTVLAAIFKPQYALDDAINALGFAILGCFFGRHTTMIRLQSYEIQRLLTIEGQTDALTGLYNRRKLFETLDTAKPADITGILMIDIDHFKEYNERHGHLAADDAMKGLGEILLREQKITFYRYGGEEFVGLAHTIDREAFIECAEALRQSVENAAIGAAAITISIGGAYHGDEESPSYEAMIEQADKAVFKAKQQGRNRVVIA